MKTIKYVLFIIILCFFSMVNVNAYYKSKNTENVNLKNYLGETENLKFSFINEDNKEYIKINNTTTNEVSQKEITNNGQVSIQFNHFEFIIENTVTTQMYAKNFQFAYQVDFVNSMGSRQLYYIRLLPTITYSGTSSLEQIFNGFAFSFSKNDDKMYFKVENIENIFNGDYKYVNVSLTPNNDTSIIRFANVKQLVEKDGQADDYYVEKTYQFQIKASDVNKIYELKTFDYVVDYDAQNEIYYIRVKEASTGGNSATCTYKLYSTNDNDNSILVCTVNDLGVTCTDNFSSSTTHGNSLNSLDYLSDNSYDCNKVPVIYLDGGIDTDGNIFYDDIKNTNNCTKACLTFNILSGDENPVDPGQFDRESFCSLSNVKAAFRVVGWVIFILKIVIPLIIIVLGSIDLFKAVVSNKNDELNKSIKSLIMRAIAGIIVFFVPTIVNFAVTLISGGEEIYSEQDGTFKNCTYCMLNPQDDNCGSLMGGN